ncbi:hypothetical protein [Streptomyces cyaneus]|uniref:hypothetical protein n=1 Tax=Streptomyces cyaneus TaxID=1904 RepID=UPI000FF89322|nr:hypothetical protein [Streptomyces cyaneus]
MSLDDEDDDWESLLNLPPMLGVAPLLALAGMGLSKLLRRGQHGPQKWDCVKLVHADDLQTWTVFPRYQDIDTLTYGDYRVGAEALRKVRKRVAPLLKVRRKLADLDSDQVVSYHTEYVDVPRSLLRQPVRLRLKHERIPGTWLESDDGTVSMSSSGDSVLVRAGWGRRLTAVRFVGPSRVAHKEAIERITQEWEAATEEQRSELAEVETSRFGHPVLFVSHRWETDEHPDPTGQQLQRLRALKDCWIVYDYASFPQLPRTEAEEAQFKQILDSMAELITKVVILSSPDYLTRGWLVFEYLVASLAADIVCDEVNDPDFVNLRDWVATQAPLPTNLWRDSWESQQNNHINRMVLAAVNRLLPTYGNARFRTEHDSTKVTELLVERLKAQLPPRKEYQLYLGEWKSVPWTAEDLAKAFQGEIEIPPDHSMNVRPFRTRVPTTLEEAVAQKYKVRKPSWKDRTNPFGLL